MLLQGWCGCSHLGEEASVFIKSNVPLAYDPVIPLTCLPKKHENVHTMTCTQMFRAAVFNTSSRLETTQMDINRQKFWYIHAMKNYLGLKKEACTVTSKNTDEYNNILIT